MNEQAEKQALTATMGEANLYGLLLTLPPIVLITAVYAAFWGFPSFTITADPWVSLALLLIVFVVGIVIHELLHAVTWKLLGKLEWDELEIGFQWKTLTPYAHAKRPIPVGPYRWGVAMPGLILGILPAFIAIITGSSAWYMFAFLFIFAAGGDALILWLIRHVPSNFTIEDHPTLAGCYAVPPTS